MKMLVSKELEICHLMNNGYSMYECLKKKKEIAKQKPHIARTHT